jgi:hypothetical protein
MVVLKNDGAISGRKEGNGEDRPTGLCSPIGKPNAANYRAFERDIP